MSDTNINIDFMEFIKEMRMDKQKTDVFMLDFEKTSPFHTAAGGIIMDIGYNFIDLGAATDSSNMSKPAHQFIKDNTAKVVYEVLRNPVFYKELSALKRVKRESNAFLYGYYELLENQQWFSSELSPTEIAAEFRSFAYQALKGNAARIEKQSKRHLTSMAYWESKDTYKKDPTGSPSAKNRMKAQERYDRAQNSLKKMQIAMQQELTVEGMLAIGNYSLTAKIQKMQENYNLVLYKMAKEPDGQFYNGSSTGEGVDYNRTWAQDKIEFEKMGYGGVIEPWGKIMSDMDKKLQNKSKSLLAISAYGIASEKSNMQTTSSFFGTPHYANIIDKYHNICMQNLVGRLDTIDSVDFLNLIHSKDKNVIAESMKSITDTSIAPTVSLEVYYRDIMEKPKYQQSHTGVKDAFDQSEAFIETVRQYIVPHFLEGGR